MLRDQTVVPAPLWGIGPELFDYADDPLGLDRAVLQLFRNKFVPLGLFKYVYLADAATKLGPFEGKLLKERISSYGIRLFDWMLYDEKSNREQALALVSMCDVVFAPGFLKVSGITHRVKGLSKDKFLLQLERYVDSPHEYDQQVWKGHG